MVVINNKKVNLKKNFSIQTLVKYTLNIYVKYVIYVDLFRHIANVIVNL